MRKALTTLADRRSLLALVGFALLLSMPTQAKLTAGTSIVQVKIECTVPLPPQSLCVSAVIRESDFAFDSETNVGLDIVSLGGWLARGLCSQQWAAG